MTDRDKLLSLMTLLSIKVNKEKWIPGWEYTLWDCAFGKKIEGIGYLEMAQLLGLSKQAGGWFRTDEETNRPLFVFREEWKTCKRK